MYIKNYNNYLEEREEFYNNQVPIWKTKEDVTNYMTLKRENIFNYEAIYIEDGNNYKKVY